MSKLSPKDQINPTKENISKILAHYDIADFKFKIEESGVENTTLIITSKNIKYALRVYRQRKKKLEDIELEVEYINYLVVNKIPVPKIILNNSNSYISKNIIYSRTWHSILMEFIDGEHPTYYSNDLSKSFVRLQAKMHLLAIKFKSDFINTLEFCNSNKKIKDFLYTNLLSVNKIDIGKIKNKRVRDFIVNARKFSFSAQELPVAIIQKDIHADNILVKNDQFSGILDFDDLFYGPIVISLAFALWDILAKNKSLEHSRYYIKEYDSIRKLIPQEIVRLKDFILFRNYIMGTAEFLIGGENSRGKFLMPMTRYLSMEKEISSFKEEDFFIT